MQRLAVAVILFAACSSNGVEAPADGATRDAAPTDSSSCATTCGTCPAGTECVATGTVAAACFGTCHTTDDCAAGLVCFGLDVSLATDLQQDDMQPRHCLPTQATLCPGAHPGEIADGQHCDFTDPDAYAFSIVSPFGAGFECVRCAHGCGRPDGGPWPACNP